MRKIIVGGIHGCDLELGKLMVKIKLQPGVDKLIFLGDFFDRRPDFWKILKLVKALKTNFFPETVICLRGNHEQMLIDHVLYHTDNSWFLNWASQTKKSFGGKKR